MTRAPRRQARQERRQERKERTLGTLRWNEKKGFYQVWRVVMTALGIPVKTWIRIKDQRAAEESINAGFSDIDDFREAIQSGRIGTVEPTVRASLERPERYDVPIPIPEILDITGAQAAVDRRGELVILEDAHGPQLEQPAERPQLPTPRKPEVPMYDGKCPCHECPAKYGEHDYKDTWGKETGILPLYRTTVSLPVAPAALVLTLEANDPGTVDRLFITGHVLATGAEQTGSVQINAPITLNSIPMDFAVAPGGTLVPWSETTDWGLGMKIGRLDLVKNDNINVPLLNGAALVIQVETVASLWGMGGKLRQYRDK